MTRPADRAGGSPKVRTCLWFDGNGREAAEFYVSLLPGSFVETEAAGDSLHAKYVVEFTLAGTPYMTLDGGPNYPHTPAASISVLTDDQEETDRLWAALIADGGVESKCGWLTDRFGVSWQIVPRAMPGFLASDDRAAAERAFQAMLSMSRLDLATLQAAFEGR